MRLIILSLLTFFSTQIFAQADFEKKLQTKLILAEDGDVINIEAGTFALTKSLSLDGKKNITIRGKGIDKTVLNFKAQTQGISSKKCAFESHMVGCLRMFNTQRLICLHSKVLIT